MEPEDLEAATEFAVSHGALGRCPVCSHTWTTDEIDPDDDESVGELVAAARDDSESGLPEDDNALRALFSQVLKDAAPAKGCSH